MKQIHQKEMQLWEHLDRLTSEFYTEDELPNQIHSFKQCVWNFIHEYMQTKEHHQQCVDGLDKY